MSTHFDQVVEEVKAVQKTEGLTPEILVAWAAKNPKSALYDEFQWDDSQAAHEWRLQQARQLISRIVIITEAPVGQQKEFRAFTSVRTKEPGEKPTYFPTVDLLNDPAERRKLVANLLERALSQTTNYSHLPELAPWRTYTEKLIAEYRQPIELPKLPKRSIAKRSIAKAGQA